MYIFNFSWVYSNRSNSYNAIVYNRMAREFEKIRLFLEEQATEGACTTVYLFHRHQSFCCLYTGIGWKLMKKSFVQEGFSWTQDEQQTWANVMKLINIRQDWTSSTAESVQVKTIQDQNSTITCLVSLKSIELTMRTIVWHEKWNWRQNDLRANVGCLWRKQPVSCNCLNYQVLSRYLSMMKLGEFLYKQSDWYSLSAS